jgi:hypothetical protein
VIYLTLSLRNVGPGLALLNGWKFYVDRLIDHAEHPDHSDFHRLTRDLYIPSGDLGFWQGVFRDPTEPVFAQAASMIRARESFTVDLMYGDVQGGQRMISRFSFVAAHDEACCRRSRTTGTSTAPTLARTARSGGRARPAARRARARRRRCDGSARRLRR